MLKDRSEILELTPAPTDQPLSTQLFKAALVAKQQESLVDQLRDIFYSDPDEDIVALVRLTAEQATFHKNRADNQARTISKLQDEIKFLKAYSDEPQEDAGRWVNLLWVAPVVGVVFYFLLLLAMR